MSIDHRLKQAAEAVEYSVQDVDVVARLHELPKRQRARSTRAAIAALAVVVAVLVPVAVTVRDHTRSVPAAGRTSLRSAAGVTVQVLDGLSDPGLAARIRAAGYDLVKANATLNSSQIWMLYGRYWSDKIEVSVYLTSQLSNGQRDAIRAQLEAVPAVERVDYESKEDAYARFMDQFRDSPDMVRNVSPDVLPESYRVKLKNPTQFAQVHDLFCSGKFSDRGKEICNPGINTVIDQKKLTVSGIYYAKGHREDAEALRRRLPELPEVAPAPSDISLQSHQANLPQEATLYIRIGQG
jgi:hypothetical protein